MKTTLFRSIILAIILTVYVPQVAFAYIGPGSGLSAIGAFFALLTAILVAILGFFWYPIKRLLNKNNPIEPDQVKSKEE